MISRKEKIYICTVDSINIIYRIIVKYFLLFNTNLAMYKDRYPIGYNVEDFSEKIFFSFSKLSLIKFITKWEMYALTYAV